MDKLVFDATNILHITYHSSKKVQYSNAHIFSFLRSLKDCCERFSSNKIFLCWDENENNDRDNFRYDLIPEYKGHRNREESSEIHKYDETIYELTSYLGAVNIFPQKMEGDDIVSWLCLEQFKDDEKVIISSDKDFLQLISKANNLRIFSPRTKSIINENSFEREIGILPKDFLKYKILQGDSSDNIRGIYKVGPVRAKKYCKDWKNYIKNLTEEEKNILVKNTKMMDLTRGYKYYKNEKMYYENQMVYPEIDMENFFNLCRNLNLFSVENNRDEWEYTFDRDKNPMNSLKEYFSK